MTLEIKFSTATIILKVCFSSLQTLFWGLDHSKVILDSGVRFSSELPGPLLTAIGTPIDFRY